LVGLFVPIIPSPGLGDDGDSAPPPLIQIVSIGLLDHDVSDLWSGFQREGGEDFNAEIAFKSFYGLDLISDTPFDLDLLVYPAAGFSINNSGDTSKLYGDLRLEFRLDSVFFLLLGSVVQCMTVNWIRSDVIERVSVLGSCFTYRSNWVWR
jgi:hypothetical protein